MAESSNHNGWLGQSSCNSPCGAVNRPIPAGQTSYSITHHIINMGQCFTERKDASSHLHQQHRQDETLDGHVCLCSTEVNWTQRFNKRPFSNLCYQNSKRSLSVSLEPQQMHLFLSPLQVNQCLYVPLMAYAVILTSEILELSMHKHSDKQTKMSTCTPLLKLADVCLLWPSQALSEFFFPLFNL